MALSTMQVRRRFTILVVKFSGLCLLSAVLFLNACGMLHAPPKTSAAPAMAANGHASREPARMESHEFASRAMSDKELETEAISEEKHSFTSAEAPASHLTAINKQVADNKVSRAKKK
jgi:hypothetical protein